MAEVMPSRSWLFVPATRPERFAKAVESGADRVILDLEDAVAMEVKIEARQKLAAAPLPPFPRLYLRVNGTGTEWFDEDMALAARLPLAGILLPKAETAEDVRRAAELLAPEQHVIPIVETAVGLWNVLDLARSPRVQRLAFGAIDFAVDTGISGEDMELAYARSHLVIASRVAGIAAPIDSVTPAIEDGPRVLGDSARSRAFGFAGKLCIHPKQIPLMHSAFRPTEEDVDWARGLLDALAARPESERGTFSYRGGMVDRPVIERARQILADAEE